MAARFEDLAQLAVETFDRVGRGDDLSHFGGIGKEGDDLFPRPPPARGLSESLCGGAKREDKR